MKLLLLLLSALIVVLVKADDEPSRCITLALFKDQKCEQEHPFAVSFSTWSVHGSPCLLNNPIFGISNQFCGPLFYSQVVNLGDCNNPFRTMEQVLMKGVCEFGFKMVSCKPRPCDKTDGLVDDNLGQAILSDWAMEWIESQGDSQIGLLEDK